MRDQIDQIVAPVFFDIGRNPHRIDKTNRRHKRRPTTEQKTIAYRLANHPQALPIRFDRRQLWIVPKSASQPGEQKVDLEILKAQLAQRRKHPPKPRQHRRMGQIETVDLSVGNSPKRMVTKPHELAVFVHGLCMSDLQWRRRDHDHGEALANALGYSTLYLHYNSGLHISSNGRELAEQLEALVDAWPVPLERLTIIGYSMGGLLARSACEHARETGQRWLGSLRDLIFIGTPHDGSPLERAGNRIDRVLGRSPYTVALSRLGKMRSAGITDLRHANLSDSDWQGQDRFHSRRGVRKAMPLPESVHCRAIAGTLSKHLRLSATRLAGDGLVPVSSALGRHPDPQRNLGLAESDCMIAYARNHLDLLDSAEVFEQIRVWLDDASPGSDLRIPWSESFS